MSLSPFVTTHPEVLSSAAGDLAGIGSSMAAANAAAAAPTGGVMPAAADEVSALTAAQFAGHAGNYQAIGAAAEAIHSLLVSTLQTNATCYADAEAANAIAAG
jgi:PE family